MSSAQSGNSRLADICEFVSLVAFVVCVYFHSVYFSVALLALACVFHWRKAIEEGIRAETERDDFLLQIAGLNPKDFMASNRGSETEGSEEPRICRYYHRASGRYLFLSLDAKFWEWQDDVYGSDSFHAPLGGIVKSGTQCKTLVEVGRERAMANLECPVPGVTAPNAQGSP
jgi:hypothetical protein